MDEVEAAFLQTGTMINGCSQTETTLNTTRIKGVKMHLEPGFLVVTVKDKTTKIPSANLKGVWIKDGQAAVITRKAK